MAPGPGKSRRNMMYKQKGLIAKLHKHMDDFSSINRIGLIVEKNDGSILTYDTKGNFGELLAHANVKQAAGSLGKIRVRYTKRAEESHTPDNTYKHPYRPVAAPVSPAPAAFQTAAYSSASPVTPLSAPNAAPMEISAYHQPGQPIASLLVGGGRCLPSTGAEFQSSGSACAASGSGLGGYDALSGHAAGNPDMLPVVRLPWMAKGRYKDSEDPYGQGGLLGDDDSERDEDEEEDDDDDDDDEEEEKEEN